MKIGKTINLAGRLSTYNTGCPQRSYTYAFTIQVADDLTLDAAESAVHNMLAGVRVGAGEWFTIHPDDAYQIALSLDIWR